MRVDVRPPRVSARAVDEGVLRPVVPGGNRFKSSSVAQTKKKLPWPVVLFLFGLIIPWIIPVGPLNLSVYRIVLMATLLPCLVTWVSGRAGRLRVPDVCMLLYCAWAGVSLVKAHGAGPAVEPAGMLFVETMGPYLLARCYIRDAEDFENVITLAAKLVVLLLPFAVYEWLTGNKPILTGFGAVFPTVETTSMQRLGLWRVQGPFAHSIVFGLFCGSIFALRFLVASTGRNVFSRGLVAVTVAGTALLSMSSAPIGGLAVQGVLMSWNWLLKRYRSRWKILWALGFAGYLVVELGSNQTPIKFYISHFTFDGATGWFRLLIWQYGSASVANHPLFGIGLGEWVRPKWMPFSVDNFWLLTAMRHGIPALVFMLGSCLWILFAVAFKQKPDERLQSYRVAYLICLATYVFVGTTVHFWAAGYVWFLFLLGSGVWLLDVETVDASRARHMDRPRRDALPSRRQKRGSRSEIAATKPIS
jgi:hypothetical protein